MHVIPRKTQEAVERNGRFRRQIIIVTILVNVLGYAFMTWVLAQSRQSYQANAETTAQNVAKMLRHNIASSLQTAEMSLLVTKAEIEHRQAQGNLSREELKAFLMRMPMRLPFMSDIEVVDARYASSSSAHDAAPAYAQFLRDHPLAGLYISRMPPKRAGDDETLLLSQRFNHPDGSFAGILNSQFNLRHFHALFSSLDVGENGVISLWNETLGILASHPQVPKAEQAGTADTIRSWQATRSGSRDNWLSVAESPADKMMRTTASHKINGFPLYVSVGLAAEDYFGKWWQAVATAGESLLMFTMMTALLALATYHIRCARVLSSLHKCRINAPRCHRIPFRSITTAPDPSHSKPAWRRDRTTPSPMGHLETDLLTKN